MTTIYDFDLAVHIQYARRIQFNESEMEVYGVRSVDAIPSQVQVVDVYPRQSELDLLLGVVPRHAPYAYFYPPQGFDTLRKAPFAFSQVAPSLGSAEKQVSDMQRVAGFKCSTNEEKLEKGALTQCGETLGNINDDVGFVVGRVGQFLQG